MYSISNQISSVLTQTAKMDILFVWGLLIFYNPFQGVVGIACHSEYRFVKLEGERLAHSNSFTLIANFSCAERTKNWDID